MKVIYKLGDDISTDHIYPGRYMATVLPTETPQYAFGDLQDLNTILNEGDKSQTRVIVAGSNFGTGSSREQAVSTLVGHNLLIVARNFARIFFQNSINLGLKTIICPTIEANVGDNLDFFDNKIVNSTSGKEFPIVPIPEARKAIVEAGGLISYTRKLVLERQK
jgi:3-isopropylmalate/(R)-2-methylmalate dehydratase small subunit